MLEAVEKHKCERPRPLMSALGHEPTSRHVRVMSVSPLKAVSHQRALHVRLVPIADMPQFVLGDCILETSG